MSNYIISSLEDIPSPRRYKPDPSDPLSFIDANSLGPVPWQDEELFSSDEKEDNHSLFSNEAHQAPMDLEVPLSSRQTSFDSNMFPMPLPSHSLKRELSDPFPPLPPLLRESSASAIDTSSFSEPFAFSQPRTPLTPGFAFPAPLFAPDDARSVASPHTLGSASPFLADSNSLAQDSSPELSHLPPLESPELDSLSSLSLSKSSGPIIPKLEHASPIITPKVEPIVPKVEPQTETTTVSERPKTRAQQAKAAAAAASSSSSASDSTPRRISSLPLPPIPYVPDENMKISARNMSSSSKPEQMVSSHSSSSNSGAEPPKKRQRRRGPLTADALAVRRAKHNQVEIRRRQKIAASFDQLRGMVDCEDTNKGVILQSAIDKLKQYQSRLAKLARDPTLSSAAPAPSSSSSRRRKSPAPPAPVALPSPSPSPSVVGAGIVCPPSATSTAAQDEQFYTNMFLHGGVAMLFLSLSGLLVECNHKFADMVGSSREQLRAQSDPKQTPAGIANLVPPQSQTAFLQAVTQLLRKELLSSDAIRAVVKQDGSGETVDVRSMMWLVKENASAPPQYVKCVLTPISDGLPPSVYTKRDKGPIGLMQDESMLFRSVPVGC